MSFLLSFFRILVVNSLRGIGIFFIVFCIYFWDLINVRFFDYFYNHFEKEFKKEDKIVAFYFSVHTFENLQRRYVREFYFLEKFFKTVNVKYLVLTDKNLNLLSKDIDLLIVNDCRYLPISSIMIFQEYANQGGKILFLYQSLMFNNKGNRYLSSLYKSFGLYDIVFDNRKINYFSFKHFTKILLSRKYSVVFFTDENNVLSYSSENIPFVINYGNYYFVAENVFTIENLSNPFIFKFNIYLLNLIVPNLIDGNNFLKSEVFFYYDLVEFVMPIEFILNNKKTRKYFYNSKKMIGILKFLDDSLVIKNKLIKVPTIKIGLQKISLKDYEDLFFSYAGSNFRVLIKKNNQQGIEEYFSFRYRSIISSDPLVIAMDVEEYVVSVVTSEMPDSFLLEALKAQAVTARTYCIKNKNRHKNFDLCDKPHCQNFEGEKQESFKSFIATYFTCGKIIVFKGKPIDAVYHSTCGGLTANSQDVWNISLPYLIKTKDYTDNINNAYCKESRLFTWKIEFSKKEAENILAKTIPYLLKVPFQGKIVNIEIVKNSSLRVEKMIIKTTQRNYVALKDDSIYLFSKDLYFSLLPSNFIEKVEISSDRIIFYGRGFGHGVGMCQFGANHLAKFLPYNDIIKHYYNSVDIIKVY